MTEISIEKIETVDEYLAVISQKIEDYKKIHKEKAERLHHEQRHSIGTRYVTTMHLLFGQLMTELNTHLSEYPKTVPVLKRFYKEEYFQKADFYFADMVHFLSERGSREVDEGKEKFLEPLVHVLKMRTEGPTRTEKLFYVLGLMQIQVEGTVLIMKLIGDLGWKHWIGWDRHDYWNFYIPLVKTYLDELKTALAEDLEKKSKKGNIYKPFNNSSKKIEEYIDLVFTL